MSEENQIQQDNAETFTPPPPYNFKEEEEPEPPQMSEIATLGNIFLEPGRTFEDLRRKPRFIMAILLFVILATVYQFALLGVVGPERVRRVVSDAIEKSSQTQSMSAEQKSAAVDFQMKIQGVVKYAVPVFVVVAVVIGGLLYWLGMVAGGGSGSFARGLSVWIYSALPSAVVMKLASFLVMFLKSPDDIDLATAQNSLIHANASLFLDGKTMPLLLTILSTVDVFFIWGLVLAAIGFHKVGKLSKGTAWTVVIVFASIVVLLRVIGSVTSGNPVLP